MIRLKQEQFLPINIDQAWSFFSNPQNLNEITPDDMVFEIISDLPDTMYEGLLINYRLKPMFNLSVNWVTEITHVKQKLYFIDEQRKGPYKIWHHEHHFKEVPNGIIMTDLLFYDIGKSVVGWLAGKIFVDKKVKSIFEYRHSKLKAYFAGM